MLGEKKLVKQSVQGVWKKPLAVWLLEGKKKNRTADVALSWSPKGLNALTFVTAHIAIYKSATVALH